MAVEPTILDEFDLPPGKPHPGRRMTEEEFEAWVDEDTRAEWVDGEVIMMSPASRPHNHIINFLCAIMEEYARHHDLGEVLGPEFEVHLDRRRRVPDVLFVAKDRLAIMKRTYADGPPDLIMEIVSADSEARDWREKYMDYQEAGVREYWIIDPNSQHLEAYRLVDGQYIVIAPAGDRILSDVLPGFFLKPEWLWSDPLPRILETLKQLGLC